MPDLEDIVQRIALSGQDDVIASFGEIGKAGTEAFNKIAESAGTLGKVIGGVAGAFTAVLGVTAVWAHHSSEAAHSLELLSQRTGESVESISALQSALSALGGGSEGLGTAFQRMGLNIAREWEQIKKDVENASDTVINNNLKVDQAEQALFHAKQERNKVFGLPGATAAQLDSEKRLEANTKLESSEQALHEAQKQRAKDRLNAPEAYAKAVDKIIHSEQTFAEASKTANLSAENVIKGLIVNTKGADEAFEHFHGGVNELIGEGPKVKDVLYNLADFMKNSGNAALNSSIQVRLLGRGLHDDLISVLPLGSAALKEQEKAMEHYGLVLTEEMIKPGLEFHAAYSRLSHDLSITTTQIGLAFAPSFTAGMKDLTEYLEKNHDALLKWGSDLAGKVTPYIEGFFDSLKGLAAFLAGDKLDPKTNAGQWEASWARIAKVVEVVAKTITLAIDGISVAISGLTGATGLKGFEIAAYGLVGLAIWKTLGKSVAVPFLAGFAEAFVTGLAGALATGGLISVPVGKAAAAPGVKPPVAVGAAAPAIAPAEAAAAGLLGGLTLKQFLARAGVSAAIIAALYGDVTRPAPPTEQAGDLLEKSFKKGEITAEEFSKATELLSKVTGAQADKFKELTTSFAEGKIKVDEFIQALGALPKSAEEEARKKKEHEEKAKADEAEDTRRGIRHIPSGSEEEQRRRMARMGFVFPPKKPVEELTADEKRDLERRQSPGGAQLRFPPTTEPTDTEKRDLIRKGVRDVPAVEQKPAIPIPKSRPVIPTEPVPVVIEPKPATPALVEPQYEQPSVAAPGIGTRRTGRPTLEMLRPGEPTETDTSLPETKPRTEITPGEQTATVVSEVEQQRRNETAADYQRYDVAPAQPDIKQQREEEQRRQEEQRQREEEQRRREEEEKRRREEEQRRRQAEQAAQMAAASTNRGGGEQVATEVAEGGLIGAIPGFAEGGVVPSFAGGGNIPGIAAKDQESVKRAIEIGKEKVRQIQEEQRQQQAEEKAQRGQHLGQSLKASEAEWDRALRPDRTFVTGGFAEGGEVGDDDKLRETMHQQEADHAEGGPIKGWGSGKSDSVPIRASVGEYIVTADGSNLGDAIAHFTKGFAEGGEIDGASDYSPEQSERIERLKGQLPSSAHVEDLRQQPEPDTGVTMPLPLEDLTQVASFFAKRAFQAFGSGDDSPKSGPPDEMARKLGIGAIGDFPRHKLEEAFQHFAQGGLVRGFVGAVSNIPGYANGGQVNGTASSPAALGHHELDIRTNAGNFTAKVDGDTMEAIRNSSLGGKLSSTGGRPTWYS